MTKLKFLKFPEDTFTRIAWLFILVLIALVVVFALLNTDSVLKVLNVQLIGGEANSEIENQKLTVRFNRPLAKDSVTNAVTITPTTKYTISWQGNDLVVNFNQNLLSDTNYKFTINAAVQDVYHSDLAGGFTTQFHTKPEKLFYLENNPVGQASRIMSANPDLTNVQDMYNAENIAKFAVSKQYLAVVIAYTDKAQNDLILKNFQTGEIRTITFKEQRVNKVVFSPSQSQMAVIVQNFQQVQGVLIPEAGSHIRIYDLDSLQYTELNPQNSATEVGDILYDPTGQTLLYKTTESDYFIADLGNPSNLVILSKHLTSTGFDRQADKIMFVDFDPLNTYSSLPYFSLYNSDKSTTRLTGYSDYAVDPQFLNNSQQIVFAKKFKDVEGTKGLFQIMLGDYAGNSVMLYTDPTHSVELPKPSFDDRYIVVERYNQEDMLNYTDQRDFQFQTKPSVATLLVIDQSTGALADQSIRGIDAVWQP